MRGKLALDLTPRSVNLTTLRASEMLGVDMLHPLVKLAVEEAPLLRALERDGHYLGDLGEVAARLSTAVGLGADGGRGPQQRVDGGPSQLAMSG